VGRATQALCGYFDHCVGIDIAASMIAQARDLNRFAERCEYVLNESDDLSVFTSDSFDLIYSNLVLQHLEPPFIRSYLKEFIRLLNSEGLLVFQLPSHMLVGESVREYGELCGLEPEEVENCVGCAGRSSAVTSILSPGRNGKASVILSARKRNLTPRRVRLGSSCHQVARGDRRRTLA
jgi:SAM-dependent methyltransferase